MNPDKLKPTIEALLSAADQPLSVNQLFNLFSGDIEHPGKDDIRKVLHELVDEYRGRGLEINQVASGFRLQANAEHSTWIARLWEQKPPRYSRALLETLALIAYRQPITRGEIEAIRGVSVSSNIIKTLQERDWVKTLGHKDVPGKPSLYGTTSGFLDYFNLKSLNELPTLSELKDLDQYHPELAFDEDNKSATADTDADAQVPEGDIDAEESPVDDVYESTDDGEDEFDIGAGDEVLDEDSESERL
jgi:segregation and condensation protein B